MCTYLPKVDCPKRINQILAIVQKCSIHRLPIPRHELEQVHKANIDANRTQSPKEEDVNDHNIEIVSEHQHIPAEKFPHHSEEEDPFASILIS